jgi:lipopolysaccharide export system protein LptA
MAVGMRRLREGDVISVKRLGVNPRRLRWGLLACALLLTAIVVGYLSYGRYRIRQVEQSIVEKARKSLAQISENVTYSHSNDDKTMYTIHAAKVTPLGDNKYSLHEVVLTLYGRTPGEVDYVRGADFEYDEKEGVVKALGEVDMELQPPQSVVGTGRSSAAMAKDGKAADVIHVRTRGLVYIRKLGVAATDQQVDFDYGAIHGSSLGAEFYNGENILHLLADVRMEGVTHGAPMVMTADKADIDRTANVAAFVHPVVSSQGRSARADHAVAYLRHDSSLERLEATGSVMLAQGTRQVNAARLDATMGATSIPEHAKFSGGVKLTDTSALRPMQGSATEMETAFNGKGELTSLVAQGNASMAMVDHSAGTGLRRQMSGDRVLVSLLPGAVRGHGTKGGSSLSEIHAMGRAQAQGDSLSAATKTAPAQLKTTHIEGDDLLAKFEAGAGGQSQLRTMDARGHTLLQQNSADGAEENSAGDTLAVVFAANAASSNSGSRNFGGARIASAVQSGHVTIRNRAAKKPGANAEPQVMTASANRANYDGAANKLTLAGSAHLSDETTELAAASVVMDETTGDAEARGSVSATMQSKQPTTGAASTQPPAHVLAASARLSRNTKLLEFQGTDAQPARLWQGASQVDAASLLLDGDRHTLAARPANADALIHAVFAGATAQPTTNSSNRNAPKPGDVVRVASQKMDYADLQREARFAGAVRIDGLTGDVRGQRAVVLLNAAKNDATRAATATPFGGTTGSIDRVVITGDVQLQQPGRQGTGESLVYTAASNNYVLTGTTARPPKITDAQQGTVTGTTLVFADSGSTIIVAGTPASSKGSGTRVRTETEVRNDSKK